MTRRMAKRCLAVTVAALTFMAVTSVYPLSAFNPIWITIWGLGYEAALRNGPSEIGPVGQFVELYPDAQHTISYYTGQVGQPQWTSTVGLHGRYILSVSLDIEFDWSRRHVRSYGSPRYILKEVSAVRTQPGGATEITYVSSTQRNFGPAEWERLHRAGGDLGALGVRVVKDRPVAHFERAWPD